MRNSINNGIGCSIKLFKGDSAQFNAKYCKKVDFPEPGSPKITINLLFCLLFAISSTERMGCSKYFFFVAF